MDTIEYFSENKECNGVGWLWCGRNGGEKIMSSEL